MADRRVAGERLDPGGGLPVGTAEERLLDSAVLEAECDLEVEDALAVALETEVPRLDDSRVDRADGDLVDFVPLDAEEVADGGQDRLALLPPPRVVARTPRRPVADRLEPRVPLGLQAELLGHLTLEEVRLRRCGRQRRKAVVGENGARDGERPGAVVGDDRPERRRRARLRRGEEGDEAAAGGEIAEEGAAERVEIGRRGRERAGAPPRSACG